MRVIVCDDHVDAADSLAALIRTWGHEASACYSGESCLERARALKHHAFVLDIGLPDMNGYDLARSLRAETEVGNPLLLIAVAGYNDPRDLPTQRAAGFDYHVARGNTYDRVLSLLATHAARFNLGWSTPGPTGSRAAPRRSA